MASSPRWRRAPGRGAVKVAGPALVVTVALGGMLSVATMASAQDYEIWALDQGTHVVHIFNSDLEEVDRINMEEHGVLVPHMIHFTSDGAYAFIASTRSGDVSVIRAADREVVAVLDTGPGTHMAVVKPDDSAAIADVIGSPDVERDGKVVEITIDRENEAFEIGRSLVIAEDPLFQENAHRFNDVSAICHEYSPDGRYAFVTLGPGLADGGLVVLDTEEFTLTAAYPPDELKVNCGTMPTPDGKHMFVNGGSMDEGIWYVLDIETHEIVAEGDSQGQDAHGVWATPDGREMWMVNRVSSNAIVFDAETLEIVAELDDIGKTPDIIAMSPDSQFAFITLRGPNPVSAPHIAIGETPGFSVVSIPERRLIEVIQPAADDERSDFHGIGVRVINE
jgi:DNA-binding beta-propeller fold protein YncE